MSKRTRTTLIVAALIALALIIAAGTYGLVRSLGDSGGGSGGSSDPSGIEQYRDPWTSAMRKARVEATFPSRPIPVTELESAGSHPFEGTFTSDEITALMNVYPFTPEGQQRQLQLEDPIVGFPSTDEVLLKGTVTLDGSTYRASLKGTAFLDGDQVSGTAEKVTVSGLTLPDAQSEQVSDLVIRYVNGWIDASPGLSLSAAKIGQGDVHVSGTVPDTLTNPAP